MNKIMAEFKQYEQKSTLKIKQMEKLIKILSNNLGKYMKVCI